MSYAPGAPAAVWAIPSLDAGAKLTLMYLWSRADHDAQRDHRETTVWVQEVDDETPTAALLIQTAASTGTTTRAVRGHLSKLRKLGLVKTHGRLVKLTPACQSCHCGGAACRCSVDTKTSESAAEPSGHDTKPSAAAVKASLQLNPSVPSVSPSPGDDAGARPDTPSDNPAPEEHTRHDHEQNPSPVHGGLRDRADLACPSPGELRGSRRSPAQAHGGPVPDGDAQPQPAPTVGRLTPEEHTHGDTRPDPLASADEARTRHRDQAPGAGRSLADHAAAIRARPPERQSGTPGLVTGKPRHDPRGAGDHRGGGDSPADATPGHAPDRRGAQGGARTLAHAAPPAGAGVGRLSTELAKAVSDAGSYWAQQQTVSTRFCEDVQACVADIGLTPEELTRALQAWETWDRSERPNRREVLWARAAPRAWVRKAAGLGGEVVKFAPLSGGAVVDTTPYWAKPGFVPEEEVS